MKTHSASIDASCLHLPARRDSGTGEFAAMKYKRALTVLGVILFGIITFLLGRYSVHSQYVGVVPRSGNVGPVKTDTLRTASDLKSPNPPVHYPAVQRQPSGHYIVRNGNSYDAHIQMFSESLRGVALTGEQIQQIQDVYSSVCAARLDYETSIANVAIISPQETLIEIPTYEAFGEKLKMSAYAMFEEILGQNKAREFIGQLDRNISFANQFWGSRPQAIQTVYDPASNVYKVRRTVYADDSQTVALTSSESRLSPGRLFDFSKFGSMFPKSK